MKVRVLSNVCWFTFVGKEVNFEKVVDPNVVSTLLKQFLRELPEPLLTFKLYRPFVHTLGTQVHSMHIYILNRIEWRWPTDSSSKDEVIFLKRFQILVAKFLLPFLVMHNFENTEKFQWNFSFRNFPYNEYWAEIFTVQLKWNQCISKRMNCIFEMIYV